MYICIWLIKGINESMCYVLVKYEVKNRYGK